MSSGPTNNGNGHDPKNRISDLLPRDRDPQGSYDPLQAFIDLFPDGSEEQNTQEKLADLPLEERLRRHIIDGEKRDVDKTLEEARGKYPPLDIINEHLLDGMKTVGELFGSGQMQLPFVLQSAETMKAAVALLATVKGDVHDIGKNLVDIILSNNGFTVHNIGIKQPVNAIIQAWQDTKADAIGMSGLLVKSVNAMEDNLREMVSRGLSVPVLLGGAALARHYCESHLRPIYREGGGRVFHGTDAFEGLRLMNQIMAGNLESLEEEIHARIEKREQAGAVVAKDRARKLAEANSGESDGGGTATLTRSDVATDIPVPKPPFWGERLVEGLAIKDVYPYINKKALFRGQWQFRRGKRTEEEFNQQIRTEVEPLFRELCAKYEEEGIFSPSVVYGYFPVQSEGNSLIVFDPEDPDKEIERFTWPRQQGKKRLCVADYFRSTDSGEKDVLGMHCVTVGQAVTDRCNELFKDDKYQDYLYLHGLGVECAEGLAELWHKRMRQEMGIDSDDSTRIEDLFTQKFRGSRYSFGYPAVPDMADQEILFRLLQPERLGLKLTENWQIDPEQSTSAIIVHHPEAKYFGV